MISHFQGEMAEGSNKFGAFASAVSRLGNFSEEEVPPENKSVPSSRELSGAQGLLSHGQSLKSKTKPKQEDLDRAHAQQEDLQLKMKILMQSPQLWLQFKSRLSSSDHGMGSVGVQKVLHEFLQDHPEIEEQLVRDQQEAAMRNKGGFRRMSILETVTNLTSDLAGEAAVRNNNTSIRNSLGTSVASSSSFRMEHEARRSGSLGTPNDESATSFIGNASEIGMNFLKRASLAATNSLGGSQRSLSDEEASVSSMVSTIMVSPGMASPASTRSSLSSEQIGKLKDGPSGSLLVPFNETDEDGYVSTDDEDGYLSTDGDDDEELEDGFVNLSVSKPAGERATAA